MRIFIVTAFLLLNFVSTTEAQRIRYKNLFPILQSKDYKTAEPQLLKFLEENDDEANAYFYLGEIIVSKMDTVEIFPNTEKFDSMANKAISAYKRSIELVDDREVRKNDDYYAAYNRRDLRTGKFGIKKSDIHLDYENKIKAVTKKKELVTELHDLRDKSVQEYERFTSIVEDFYANYPNESAFLLRAKPTDIQALKRVVEDYEKFIASYKELSDKLKALNHPSYNPELTIVEITSWDGLTPIHPDFSDFSISIQDYSKYLKSLNDKVEKEVKPLKDLLYKTDAAFDEAIMKNKAATDSSHIQKMEIPQELTEGLNGFEGGNVILNLLKYKKQKSQTQLLTNSNLFPVLADSSNIYQRANLVQEYKEQLTAQLDLINAVDENINETVIKDFQLFLDGFEPSIEAYIETESTVLEKKLEAVRERNETMAREIQFFTHESDSIYLTPLIAATFDSRKYVLNTLELDSMLLAGGLFETEPFVASAGFDMKVKSFKLLADSTYTIKNMMMLNNNLLVNLQSNEDEKQSQILKYLSPTLEEIWTFEYESVATLGDAKVEAGIFFIYDQEGNVLQTLNSSGEKIGN